MGVLPYVAASASVGFLVVTLLSSYTDALPGRVRRQASPETEQGVWRVIEMYLICDFTCNTKLKDKNLDPEKYMYDVAKEADMRLIRLQLHLVVVGIEVWNISQRIEESTQIATYRENAGKYRVNHQLGRIYSDLTFVFTGLDTNIDGGATAGLMSVSGLCAGEYGAGVMKYDSDSERWMGEALLHEIGHALGMIHDVTGCCPEGDSNCVMWPLLNSYQVYNYKFSTCSMDVFEEFQKEENFVDCVYDIPITAYTPSGVNKCGNGVVEDGEECDCGNNCDFGCCNCCADCKLRADKSAQCFRGLCCNMDTCQHRGSSEHCRNSTGQCDRADVCPGDSADCPDTTEPLMSTCSDAYGLEGYCVDGVCQTRSTQCQAAFTDEFREAEEPCYADSIKYPSGTGNCGNGDTGYIACTQDNYRCSVLKCRKVNGTVHVSDKNGFRLYYKGREIDGNECVVIYYPPWASQSGLEQVKDGTSCGSGMACWSGTCTDLATVTTNMENRDMTETPKTEWCGDGKITGSEECDCGSKQCECCDIQTCKFIVNGGACQYTSCGACGGDTTACTKTADDFTPCADSKGNCVKGTCISRTTTCQKHFGSDAVENTVLYQSNSGKNTSVFNNGAYLLRNDATRAWDSVKQYEPLPSNGCGILLCITPKSGKVYDENGSLIASETFYHNDAKKDTRVLYYSIEMVWKDGARYRKFYPIQAEDGTPCTTQGGERGACVNKFLMMDRVNWNWLWYSKCLPLQQS